MADFSAQTNPDDTVRVSILGREYTLHAMGNADYVKTVAALVNQRMNDILRRDRTQSPANIAVLAALEFAHEALDGRQEQDNLLKSVEERTRRLDSRLDKSLTDLELWPTVETEK